MEPVLQALANGVIIGAIVALTAVGLSLIYSILDLTNFAHGDTVTVGAYAALAVNIAWGVSPWVGVLVGMLVGAVISVVLEVVLWSKLRRSGADRVTLIVVSIGLALFLRNLIIFIYGTSSVSYQVPVEQALLLGPVMLTPQQIQVTAAAALAALAVHLILQYTTIGKAMRALADNMDLAWVSGVNVDNVILWTWVLGGLLAAGGGALYAFTRPINPNLGWFLLLPMFAAIILGGIGNAYGAMLGGLLIGVTQELSALVIPNHYKLAVGYAVMIAILFLLPRGLLGKEDLT